MSSEGPATASPDQGRMRSLLHRLGQPFLRNFNGQERRLVVQVAVIGLAVSLAVLALKEAVHWLFAAVMRLVELSPTPLLIFAPLLLGAAGTTWIVLRRPSVIRYHDKDDVIHELNDVDGDGLERAIALYFSSEPALERALLGAPFAAAFFAVEVWWRPRWPHWWTCQPSYRPGRGRPAGRAAGLAGSTTGRLHARLALHTTVPIYQSTNLPHHARNPHHPSSR